MKKIELDFLEVHQVFSLLRDPGFGFLKNHCLGEEPSAGNNFRNNCAVFPCVAFHSFLRDWNPALESERLWVRFEQLGYIYAVKSGKKGALGGSKELRALEKAAAASGRSELQLFRFHCDDFPEHCINAFRPCRCDGDDSHSQERVSEIFSAFSQLLERHSAAPRGAALEDKAFLALWARLPCLSSFLPQFWTYPALINLYNLFSYLLHALHPLLDLRAPEDRYFKYAEASLHVGGHLLTLYDLKHVLLRRATPPPAPPRALSSRKRDAAALRALSPAPAAADPRLHFALHGNCRSDPPLHVLPPAFPDGALDRAVAEFRELLGELQEKKKEAVKEEEEKEEKEEKEEPLLPRFVGWYLDDFGGEAGVRAFFGLDAARPLPPCAPWDFAPHWDAARAFHRAHDDSRSPLRAPPHAVAFSALHLFSPDFFPLSDDARVWVARSAPSSISSSAPSSSFSSSSSSAVSETAPGSGAGGGGGGGGGGSGGTGGAQGVVALASSGDALVVTRGALARHLGWRAAPELLGAFHGAGGWEELPREAAAAALQRCGGMLARLRLEALKVGVLEVREGQTTENEFFANCHAEAGARYLALLAALGDWVPLRGWTRYAAGLDTGEKGENGEEALFAECRLEGLPPESPPLEMMFHVATRMPLSAKDEQQIQRKRHLGNDAVVVVVVEEDAPPFDPHALCSKFTQVYLVVQFDARKGGYTVEPWLRQGVPLMEPVVRDRVFPDEPALAKVLLQLMIRANICSFYGSSFQSISKKTREYFLKDFS